MIYSKIILQYIDCFFNYILYIIERKQNTNSNNNNKSNEGNSIFLYCFFCRLFNIITLFSYSFQENKI